MQGTIAAHVDGGVPVITLEAGPTDAGTVGELFYFFELSCALSAICWMSIPLTSRA